MVRKAKQIVIDYEPRSAFMPFHERTQRWAVLVVHRRGGKTVAVINDLIKRAVECRNKSPRYAYVAPTYSQAKDVAWAYLKRYVSSIPGVVISEAELHVTLPGDRRIRLYGADNYERLRGIYLDGCVIDESADLHPLAWSQVLRPALADRQGWCVWIGTPKGRDSFYELFKAATEGQSDTFSMLLPASKSGLIPAEELADAKRQMILTLGRQMGEAAYNQEFECSFDAPRQGAIYAAEVVIARGEGRINPNVLKYDELETYAAFDIGAPSNTKCWIFQVVGDAIKFLQCESGSDECATPAAWVKRLRDMKYNWNRIFLPHDGETLWRRALLDAGWGAVACLPRQSREWDNIEIALGSFKRCYFNSTGCERGLDALEAYRAKEENDGVTIRNVPVHDWASHASTAFGYAHQAIRLGMLAGRAAMPSRAVGHKPRVLTGLRRNEPKGRQWI